MADIRIRQLPDGSGPLASDYIPLDNGTTRRATVQQVVEIGRPTASQAEAEAGIESSKVMTPLATKQAVTAYGLTKDGNLDGLTNTTTARVNLGLGSSAVEDASAFQPSNSNLTTLAGVTPGAAGTSILALSLASDVRSFLDTAPYVDTRTALKALDTTKDVVSILMENGREGVFNWKTGDFSAHIAADTQEGIYVKADAIAATSGAWVRALFDGNWLIEWFGASSYTDEQLIALNGDPSIDAQKAINSTAIDAAKVLGTFLGGARIRAQGQIYVFGSRYEPTDGVYIIGDGVGEWDPIFPADAKTWEGTTFLFKGTGTADITLDGITSMQHGGGWREDPANPGTYFKLFSAYNSDATGTTPATQKQFSAGIFIKENVRNCGIQNLRVCNWVGTDGISDWSNQAMSSLGDDWDFGILRRNGEWSDDANIQVVGGWREAAELNCATVNTFSKSERNRIVRAKYNGRRGLVIRGPDIWKVTAATASTVTIRWSSEIYFNPAGGTFRGSDNVTYTYTGVTHAGSDANYVFTGVTPNPSAITEVRHASTGFGNTEYQDVYCYGLDHVSGALAPSFGLSDSKAMEDSGFPLRGVKLRNFKAHTREAVCVHSHINQDITFIDPQFEGGGHWIASPSEADQAALGVAAPVRETRNLIMIAGVGLSDGSVNTTLFTPRNGFIEELQLAPRADLTGDLVMTALRSGKHTALQSKSSGEVQFRNSSGTVGFRFTDAGALSLEGGGQFTLTGGVGRINFQTGQQFTLREGTTTALQVDPTTRTVRPGADGSQRLGRSDTRWSEVHSNLLCITDGVTAPAAITGMAVIYVDTADGDLKVRFSDGTIKTIVVDT